MKIHSPLFLKLVLDTNVALDWIVFEDPAVAQLREAIEGGRVTVLTDAHALQELRDVMAREKFGLDVAKQAALIERYCAQTSSVSAAAAPKSTPAAAPDDLPPGFPGCADPDDDPFLALAYRARANLLVSRDKAVLALAARCEPFGFRIVARQEAIAEIHRLGYRARPGATADPQAL